MEQVSESLWTKQSHVCVCVPWSDAADALDLYFDINSLDPVLTAGLSGETGPSPECRASLHSLALSRSDDLRQELLRAEHLRAEAIWEDRSR